MMIRPATTADAGQISAIIRTAFADVAFRFGLNPDNCPRHPSNCQEEWIADALAKGTLYFIFEPDEGATGCVALEHPQAEVCYLERLAVLPEHRRRGVGKTLVKHVLEEARQLRAQRVEIGIIAAHAELHAWYAGLGFVPTHQAGFAHLPFTVQFMQCKLAAL